MSGTKTEDHRRTLPLAFETHEITEFVKYPREMEGGYHVFNQYVIRCETDALIEHLNERGVEREYTIPYLCTYSRHLIRSVIKRVISQKLRS